MNQEICFAHVTLEVHIKHSSGDTEQAVGFNSLELGGQDASTNFEVVVDMGVACPIFVLHCHGGYPNLCACTCASQ